MADFSLVEKIADLLQVDPYSLKAALTSRQISTGVSRRVSVIHINLDDFQAKYTRDALAKALYRSVNRHAHALIFLFLIDRKQFTVLLVGGTNQRHHSFRSFSRWLACDRSAWHLWIRNLREKLFWAVLHQLLQWKAPTVVHRAYVEDRTGPYINRSLLYA